MMRRAVGWAALSTLWLSFLTCAALAVEVGDPAPPFDLPDLDSQVEGTVRSPGCFTTAPLTALIVWDRGCPHCEEVALGVSSLADSVAPLGVAVLGILMGPDDPDALREFLWDRQIMVTHLWDESRTVASDYDLGFRHLGVFVVDSTATIRAVLDDKIPSITDPLVPLIRGLLGDRRVAPASPRKSPAEVADRSARVSLPAVHLDGRLLWLSTEGAGSGDTGLFREALENGSAFLQRWEARMPIRLRGGWTFEPVLRVSNEDETILVDGAEQLGSAHGTASLKGRIGPVHLTFGAFPLSVSPLTLQRWDSEDAPPVGGGAGCGCGPGAVGVRQRSLEVLGPDYTFEGLRAGWRSRAVRFDGWVAVPDLERTSPTDAEGIVYRRTLAGTSIDLGAGGGVDRQSGMIAPIGIRFAVVSVGQDRRTAPYTAQSHGVDRDELDRAVLVGLGPWRGMRLESEWVWLSVRQAWPSGGTDQESRASRSGVRGEWDVANAILSGQAFWIRGEEGFEPYFGALTYDPDREGPRASLHLGLPSTGGRNGERIGLTLFVRDLEEMEVAEGQATGRSRSRVRSVSLLARPIRTVRTELHLVETREWNRRVDDRTRGVVLDVRWEGAAEMDPGIRLQAIRPDQSAGDDDRTVWSVYSSLRILK